MKTQVRLPAPLFVPLGMLVGLLLVCAAAMQHRSIVATQIETQQARLDIAQARLLTMRSNLSRLRSVEPQLEALDQDRLFAAQDRLAVATLLEQQRDALNIAEIRWSIGPQQRRFLAGADSLTELHSAISLSVRVVEEQQVTALTQALEAGLPGQLRLNRLALSQSRPVTDATLASLRAGERPWVMEAQLEYDWISLTQPEPMP